jgi:hypothetical protein
MTACNPINPIKLIKKITKLASKYQRPGKNITAIMTRNTCLTCLLLVCQNLYAQTGNFESFANRQDSLIVSAYNLRDTSTCTRLVKEYESKYQKLDKDGQKNYSFNLANAYYNYCCTLALTGNKIKAITCLKKSIDKGFIDYRHVTQDKDLVSLHDDARFKSILRDLQKVGDYEYILKRGRQYNNTVKTDLPSFSYLPSSDSNLVTLRKNMHLDSIAGSGTDIFRMINLMHWVHASIRHDGNKPNPKVLNALSMTTECRKNNTTLNCRGLAIVLNECFLALGYKSRIVTCLPRDSLKIDQDCHVVDAVYVDSLKNWVMLDPTFDAYFQDENGVLLGIEEIRSRLINDKLLILNPDINWNRQYISRDYYISYLTKNLYILESPVVSRYNMETRIPGTEHAYISLVPIDYFDQQPKTKSTDTETNTTWITYKINDSRFFWKAP